MTQEEKQLLLIDLCARLPYGVKIHINSCIEEQNQMQLFDVNLEGETIGVRNEKWAFRAIPIIDDEDETKVIKPYLRPMSSMTEKEKQEYSKIVVKSQDCSYANNESATTMVNDWYLSKGFDVRGLIPKGLALEAPEGMYNDTSTIMTETERKQVLIDKIVTRLTTYKSLELLEKIYRILTYEN